MGLLNFAKELNHESENKQGFKKIKMVVPIESRQVPENGKGYLSKIKHQAITSNLANIFIIFMKKVWCFLMYLEMELCNSRQKYV